jgi:hypothetical protein
MLPVSQNQPGDLPPGGELGETGFELLATGQRPHYTVRLHRADGPELEKLPGLIDDYRALVDRALAS